MLVTEWHHCILDSVEISDLLYGFFSDSVSFNNFPPLGRLKVISPFTFSVKNARVQLVNENFRLENTRGEKPTHKILQAVHYNDR